MHRKITGLIFIFSVLTACNGRLKIKLSDAEAGPRKIILSRSQVFDLSGYSFGGGSSPYNLFDENAWVDPRNEKPGEGTVPVTNCQPTIHPSIYFRGSTGNRIVADFKMPRQVSEIYIYDRSHTADSLWIYTGTLKKWKKVFSYQTVSQPGAWGWKKIMVGEESRFLMIRFSSYESAITEMVIYGTPAKVDLPEEDLKRHKGFTQTTLDHFLGVNYIMEKEPRWLKPFHYSRLYNFALDYDNELRPDTAHLRFNMLHYGYNNKEQQKYIFDIDTLQHMNNGNIWFSIRGVSAWMNKLGFTDKDRPLNRPELNSEDPGSYSRHGKMMWNMAAFFGYEKLDSNLLSISNEPKTSGRRSFSLFENGNEEDATWMGNRYCSPVEYYAQSTTDWDGDEGRAGRSTGIHAADPASKLMMSGLIGLDTNRVKTYQLLCENLRNDHQFIWQGGIQYHYYAGNGKKGISPEADSMRQKLTRVADCSFRIAPNVKCFLGENGYDKSASSWQSTPEIPGMSSARSQATMLLRSINASFFSGFDAYILYWLRDADPPDDPRVYLTSGIIRSMPDGKTLAYPGWYYISTLVNHLGRYRPDKIIRETGDVWIYRYRNLDQPDSVACFIYKPTTNGSRIKTWTLETGEVSSHSALQVLFRDNSASGIERILPVIHGLISVEVEEEPRIILYKELPSGK